VTDAFYDALVQDGDGPLVFAFHGTGGRARQVFDLAREILPGAAVVAPEGDVSEHGAQRFFRRTGEGVYDMADLTARTAAMARFVADRKAAMPGRSVMGFGYSNGANILASVMLSHPGLFDRAGLLHPLIPWQPDAQPGLSGRRILVTAGAHDPICPLPRTKALITYLKAQGAAVQDLVHPGGHELRQEELVALQSLLTGP
jgi:phospholipase/carboxylesterase